MTTEKSITAKEFNPEKSHSRFRFLTGKRAGTEVFITKEPFFIGRSRHNHLVLEERSASRKHAVLNYIDGKFILSDLNSFKGLIVNNQKVNEVELHHGDVIKIGDAELEFRDDISPNKAQVSGRNWLPIVLIGLAVVIIIVSIIFGRGASISKDLLREIEFNYSAGMKAYNVDKDMDAARAYWQKVLRLDPKGVTTQAHNARTLLTNLPSNAEGAGNR